MIRRGGGPPRFFFLNSAILLLTIRPSERIIGNVKARKVVFLAGKEKGNDMEIEEIADRVRAIATDPIKDNEFFNVLVSRFAWDLWMDGYDLAWDAAESIDGEDSFQMNRDDPTYLIRQVDWEDFLGRNCTLERFIQHSTVLLQQAGGGE